MGHQKVISVFPKECSVSSQSRSEKFKRDPSNWIGQALFKHLNPDSPCPSGGNGEMSWSDQSQKSKADF